MSRFQFIKDNIDLLEGEDHHVAKLEKVILGLWLRGKLPGYYFDFHSDAYKGCGPFEFKFDEREDRDAIVVRFNNFIASMFDSEEDAKTAYNAIGDFSYMSPSDKFELSNCGRYDEDRVVRLVLAAVDPASKEDWIKYHDELKATGGIVVNGQTITIKFLKNGKVKFKGLTEAQWDELLRVYKLVKQVCYNQYSELQR